VRGQHLKARCNRSKQRGARARTTRSTQPDTGDRQQPAAVGRAACPLPPQGCITGADAMPRRHHIAAAHACAMQRQLSGGLITACQLARQRTTGSESAGTHAAHSEATRAHGVRQRQQQQHKERMKRKKQVLCSSTLGSHTTAHRRNSPQAAIANSLAPAPTVPRACHGPQR
jgi:hypothetical protein